MNILGVSALYHDAAAALIVDGEIVAAAQEERFTRIKHDASIPQNAMKYCLNAGGISAEELDYVAFYDDSFLTLDRFLTNVRYLGEDAEDLIDSNYDNIFGKRLWALESIKNNLDAKGNNTKLLMVRHHMSHAASAFFPSPYEQSVILTIDGVGEWQTLTIGVGNKNHIEMKDEIIYPHSLGLFYSAFTWFCGFKVNSGDYKFMGLAPYGEPIYYELIKREIIDVKEDGSFQLNMSCFDYQNGKTMVNEERFSLLFGGGRRQPEAVITKREMDIAASVQKVTEEIVLKISRYSKLKYGKDIDNLVLAGGVALNCVANGKLYKEGIFKNVWVQPAASDAGGALGAALYIYYDILSNQRVTDEVHDKQKGSFLGPGYSNQIIEKWLKENGYTYHYKENSDDIIANLLAKQRIVGFFRGRMEYGPRALGHRSILADARSEEMQTRMNLKIKYRESFRPFAPAVLRDSISEYFETSLCNPYMLFCAEVKKGRRRPFDIKEALQESEGDMLRIVRIPRSDIPAVTHVDYSARIQSVDEDANPEFYRILKSFKDLTGCGVLINTSFNVRGEPIVCTPKDAYLCFMRTEMDILVLEDFILYKEEQPKLKEEVIWRDKYELD